MYKNDKGYDVVISSSNIPMFLAPKKHTYVS
uniref:Uncharacterized protein n=1 Tax=Arundo donax TaxID=35708 RepID=A0A0A9CR24_ARUDO